MGRNFGYIVLLQLTTLGVQTGLAFGFPSSKATLQRQRVLVGLAMREQEGEGEEGEKPEEDNRAEGFIFDERSDTERGTFKLGPKSNVPSPFEPPLELNSGPRTGGDGDKVVLFTCVTLALLVQLFLAINKEAPSFDSYVPIAERLEKSR